jgi:hypothetical protein
MLHLLFYLLLQLGLLGEDPAQPVPTSDQVTTETVESDAALKIDTSILDTTVGTDTQIGSSGWDDKN